MDSAEQHTKPNRTPGRSGYIAGCRCDACKAGHATFTAAQRERRKARINDPLAGNERLQPRKPARRVKAQVRASQTELSTVASRVTSQLPEDASLEVALNETAEWLKHNPEMSRIARGPASEIAELENVLMRQDTLQWERLSSDELQIWIDSQEVKLDDTEARNAGVTLPQMRARNAISVTMPQEARNSAGMTMPANGYNGNLALCNAGYQLEGIDCVHLSGYRHRANEVI